MYFPKIGGIVNAEAIAMISLAKNKPSAEAGNLRASPFPNLWARALSFRREKVVFTKNTDASFEMAGSSPGTT